MATNDRPVKGDRPDTRTPGYTYLPGGPAFQNPANLVAYLRKNPGYAWKHRSWLKAQAPREFGLAGFFLANNGQMLQYEGSADSGNARGKMVRAWVHDANDAAKLSANPSKPKVTTIAAANAKAGVVPGKSAASKAPAALGPSRSEASVSQSVTPGDPGVVDFSGLFGAADGAVGTPLSAPAGGAQLFDRGMADDMAGMQFDAEINDVAAQLGRAPRQTEQNIADIGSWFKQVLDSQRTASTRDAAINDAGVNSIRDASASILGAIGGQASGGAGLVGAAGEQAVGTLEALGSTQEQYNADIAPLLQAEAAGQKTREQALGSSQAAELAQRLAGLKTQRGQAEVGFGFEIGKQNNSIRDAQAQRALEIRQANNGLAQQNFQNQLALANAQLGATVAGVDTTLKLREAAAPAARKARHYPFGKAPTSQRQQAFDLVLARLSNPDGKPVPYTQAVQSVRNTLNGFGWSFRNPAVKTMAINVMRAAGYSPDPRNFGPR